MSKIIQFPTLGAKESATSESGAPLGQQAAIVRDNKAATVHTLVDARLPRVFYERDTKPEYEAKKFFGILRELFSSGNPSITLISSEYSDEIKLEVTGIDGSTHKLPARYYIRLTEENPDIEIDDYAGFFIYSLDALGITVNMQSEDVNYTETTLQDEELELYHPEEIQGRGQNGEKYSCEIYHKKYKPEGFATADEIEKENVTLLEIMLTTIYDAELDGIDITGADMDVTYEEEGVSVSTTIFAGRLEYILYSSLCRINPLYKNRNFKDAICIIILINTQNHIFHGQKIDIKIPSITGRDYIVFLRVSWQSDELLSGNYFSSFDEISKKDLIKNLEDWSELLSAHHHRSLLEREFQKLGIIL